MTATARAALAWQSPRLHASTFERLLVGLDALADGTGTAVELRGNPGSGKTSLLAALTEEAQRRNFRVLRGSAAEYQSDTPYLAIADALGDPLAEQVGAVSAVDPAASVRALPYGAADGPGGPTGPMTGRRCDFLRAMNSLLRDWSHDGLLLAIDDVHWADADSLEVIDYLLQQRVTVPLYLVITQRTRQAAPRLRNTLIRGVEHRTIERIELAPLTTAESAALVGMSPDSPQLQQLHRESGGIPLYLNALARIASQEEQNARPHDEPQPAATAVPEEVSTRLLAETDSLTPDELLALRAAAVIRSPVDTRLMAAVAELDERRGCDAIDGLHRRDLLRPAEGSPDLVFRHPLLQRVLYEDLAPCWRIKAHRRAAAARTALGGPDHEVARDLERFATHPDPQQAALLHRAARQVMSTEPVDAVRWLRLALRGLPDGPDRAPVLLALATALASTGALGESDEVLLELFDVGGGHEGTRAVHTAAVGLGARVRTALGDYVEARSLLAAEPTTDLARGSAGDRLDRIAALLLQGFIDLLSGRTPVRGEVDEVLRLAPLVDDPALTAGAHAMDALHGALVGDVQRATSASGKATRAIELMSGNSIDHPEFLAAAGWSELLLGRPATAERHLARGEAALRSAGQTYLLPVFLLGLTFSRIGQLRLDEARATAAAAKAIVAETGVDCGLARTVVAVDGILAALTAGPHGTAPCDVPTLVFQPGHWSTLARVWLAEAAQLTGHYGLCLNLLSPMATDAGLPCPPLLLRPRTHELLGCASAALGRPTALWAECAAAAATESGIPHHRAYALSAEAHRLRQEGEFAAAAKHYEEAADLLYPTEMAWARAGALSNAAACLAESDSPWKAERLRTAAEAIAGGTAGLDSAMRSLPLVRTAPRQPSAPPAEPDPALSALTDREREVAAITGTGLRTREVAERLQLSPRTVDVHLNRIYRKLNITSRSALVRLMMEQN